MAKLSILAGTTSKRLYVFIQDSSQTDGRGLTGLAFNTGSLVASYVLPGGSRVAITLATQTVTGAYSSGGFVEVDATNMPGVYRFDPPNAALTGGASVLIMLKGAANMAPCLLEVELTAVDNQDAGDFGLTNLDAAISSRASQTSVDTVDDFLDTEITDIRNRLPTALVGGRMDSSVGAVAANALTAAGVAADVGSEVASAVRTELATELARIDAAISSRLAAAGYTAPDNATIAAIAAFFDTEVAAIKAKTDNLPSDPADASDIAAAFSVTNGKIDTVDDFLDTEIAAIKAKTDNLPASPAAVGSAMTLDLTQAIPDYPTDGTVGDALQAAEAQGFGRWTLVGTTLTIYRHDGTTVARTFTLDSATVPTSRT